MVYSLINMSDPYTFEAKDVETAALTAMLLSPLYGAESEDGTQEVPIYAFTDKEWFINLLGKDFKAKVKEKKTDVIDALNSFVFGGFEDRRKYFQQMSVLADDEKEEFAFRWQDKHSSLNDIQNSAFKTAKELREYKF